MSASEPSGGDSSPSPAQDDLQVPASPPSPSPPAEYNPELAATYSYLNLLALDEISQPPEAPPSPPAATGSPTAAAEDGVWVPLVTRWDAILWPNQTIPFILPAPQASWVSFQWEEAQEEEAEEPGFRVSWLGSQGDTKASHSVVQLCSLPTGLSVFGTFGEVIGIAPGRSPDHQEEEEDGSDPIPSSAEDAVDAGPASSGVPPEEGGHRDDTDHERSEAEEEEDNSSEFMALLQQGESSSSDDPGEGDEEEDPPEDAESPAPEDGSPQSDQANRRFRFGSLPWARDGRDVADTWSSLPSRESEIRMLLRGRRRCRILNMRLRSSTQGPAVTFVDLPLGLQSMWEEGMLDFMSELLAHAHRRMQFIQQWVNTPSSRSWIEVKIEFLPDEGNWSIPRSLCAGPRLPGIVDYLPADPTVPTRSPAVAPKPSSQVAWPPLDFTFRTVTRDAYFVYRQRDCRWLTLHIKSKLRRLFGEHPSLDQLPNHPIPFSFAAARLCMASAQQQLAWMGLNDVWKRLWNIHEYLTENDLVRCRRCHLSLARMGDTISMSDSVLKSFVNPHGVVHDLITVHQLHEYSRQRRQEEEEEEEEEEYAEEDQLPVLLIGQPSTEASWFPGFAWTITICRECGAHIGWKFTAEAGIRTTNPSFWGISRRNIEISLRPQTRIPTRQDRGAVPRFYGWSSDDEFDVSDSGEDDW